MTIRFCVCTVPVRVKKDISKIDGAAFRYRVPGNGTRQIAGESTAWQLPQDAQLWLQTDTDDYEGNYHSVRADQVLLEEQVDNQTRPVFCGPPLTAVFPRSRS